MRKIFPVICSLALTLLLFCQATPALPSETLNPACTVDDVLLQVMDRKRTLKTFTAAFKQIQESSLFSEIQVSEGTLYFDQSGKLLMKMTRPEAYLVLITDQKITIGVPGTTSYRQKRLPGRNSFFEQVMGIDQLKNQYDIRMNDSPCENCCDIELKPLKKSRRMPFATIRAVIDTMHWLPESIRLEEPGGDVTTFHLQFQMLNQSLPETIFDIPVPNKKAPHPAGSYDFK